MLRQGREHGQSTSSLPLMPAGPRHGREKLDHPATGNGAASDVSLNRRAFVSSMAAHVAAMAVWWPCVTTGIGRASQIGPCPSDAAIFEYYAGCLTFHQSVCQLFSMIALPVGVYAAGVALQSSNGLASSPNARRMLHTSAASFVACAAGAQAVAALWHLATPQYTWNDVYFDGLRTLNGGMATAAYTLVAGAATWVGASSSRLCLCCSRGTTRVHSGMAAFEPSSWRSNVPWAIALVTVLALVAASTTVFTPIWNNEFQYYAVTDSPFSWVHTQIPGVNRPYSVVDGYVTEPAPTYFKLFTDVVVYFAYLVMVVVAGLGSHLWPPCRRRMHARLRLCTSRPCKWFNVFPHGVSVGELACMASAIGMYGFWVLYWGFLYSRIRADAAIPVDDSPPPGTPGDPHAGFNIAARTVGHLATLSVSFLLFPAARGSLWERVFGIPFERAIKYHRLFGIAAWLFTLLHAGIWYIKWALEDSFWLNMSHAGRLVVIWQHPGELWALDNALVHYDNFTMLMCQTALAGVTVMVVVALLCRRRRYEVFYYSHGIALFYLFTAILHAWTFWFYAAGPLILYGLDKAMRVRNGASAFSLLSAEHACGVTRLVFRKNGFQYHCGQYAFINVPRVSVLQWHPFSISSAPHDSDVTFHIKALSAGTFTSVLADAVQASTNAAQIQMKVDGPYGRASYLLSGTKVLVLVAGGIGITPVHSILRELVLRSAWGAGAAISGLPAAPHGKTGLTSDIAASVERVVLVWTVRDATLLTAFANTFRACQHPALKHLFELHLHCSSKGDVELPEALGPGKAPLFSGTDIDDVRFVYSILRRGRPDLASIVGDAMRTSGVEGRFSKWNPAPVMLAACGPPRLVQGVSEVAFQRNTRFHTEVFAF